MTLTGAGKIAGVIGWPIAHSLSPLLHGYWLDEDEDRRRAGAAGGARGKISPA